MTKEKLLSDYTVKVSNGSGCIFHPASQDYLYVLTAAHNLDDALLEVMTHTLNKDSELVERKLEIIGDPFRHPDHTKDAAIIKIKRFDFDGSLCAVDDPNDFPDEMFLCGYPSVRRTESFHFRTDQIRSINRTPGGYIEAKVESNPTYDEMVGFSGGGVFFIDGDSVFVAGIQSSMAAGDEENLGRINFMPVEFFQEIIAEYPDDLVELVPSYLVSFSYLSSQAMQLEGCLIDKNVAYTRGYLASLANEMVNSDLTPTYIKALFQEKLLVYNEKKTSLTSKGLWIAWLEFLMIMRIVHDRLIPNTELEEICNYYRLIFSSTNRDWAEEFPNIIRSNFHGLKKGGKVIIGTGKKPARSIIPDGMVPDIINTYSVQRGEMRIDEGIGHPLTAFKLIHISAFQDLCIIRKETEYKNFNALNEDELLAKLKLEYDQLFR